MFRYVYARVTLLSILNKAKIFFAIHGKSFLCHFYFPLFILILKNFVYGPETMICQLKQLKGRGLGWSGGYDVNGLPNL